MRVAVPKKTATRTATCCYQANQDYERRVGNDTTKERAMTVKIHRVDPVADKLYDSL